MTEILKWDEALDQFKDFLRSRSQPIEIEWVFREDIWRRNAQKILVRYPVDKNNIDLCRHVFEGGRKKDLWN
jgi:hypothetical protein